MKFLTTSNKEQNIKTAFELLKSHGINNAKLSGYSDVNGISVYFKHDDLMSQARIRVSDHSVSNPFKMQNYVCLGFDYKTLPSIIRKAESKFVSRQEMNSKILSRIKIS